MGCHTWFYKKVDRSYNEAREGLIGSYRRNIALLEDWIANPNKEEYREFFESYPEYTPEKNKYDLAVYRRRLRMIEAGLCKEATMKHFADINFGFEYVSGKGFYYDAETCHDLFRIGNYPEDKLFSLQDTLDFIERNKDKCYGFQDNWMVRLEKFWLKYPDGMIDFG